MSDTEVALPRPPLEALPWQAPALERLRTAVDSGRLPHAVLVQGPAGVGKEVFASALAAALLCTARGPALAACGQCPECRLYVARSHPDLHWVRPEEERRTIGVDQVREACEQLAMTSQRRGARIAVFSPAEVMTPSAQNALLKTLEEPAPQTLMVLLAARPSRLLATLRSRCQRLEIPCPPAAQATAWLVAATGADVPPGLLASSGGAPLRALALAPHFADLDAGMTELLEAVVAGHAEPCGAAAPDARRRLPTDSTGSRAGSHRRSGPGRSRLGWASRFTAPRCCKGALRS